MNEQDRGTGETESRLSQALVMGEALRRAELRFELALAAGQDLDLALVIRGLDVLKSRRNALVEGLPRGHGLDERDITACLQAVGLWDQYAQLGG